MIINEQRWTKLCTALQLPPDLEEFKRLKAAYSESQRAYHTLQHLAECMEKLDWAKSENSLQNTALAEVALWYHDAIYQPRATDNELKSAEWACDFLTKAGLSDKDRKSVHRLIMATCHGEKPNEFTLQLVVDVDLSILAADSQRFEEYEQQIRKEYKWVPWFIYKKKRKDILERFLNSPKIYSTKLFYTHYEAQARENLEQSIAKLSQ